MRRQGVFYPVRAEPVLWPPVTAVSMGMWWQPERRCGQPVAFFFRAFLNDLATFGDLFAPIVTVLLDMWWQPERRPLLTAAFYFRNFLNDLATFSDLFAPAPVGPRVGTRLLLGVGR